MLRGNTMASSSSSGTSAIEQELRRQFKRGFIIFTAMGESQNDRRWFFTRTFAFMLEMHPLDLSNLAWVPEFLPDGSNGAERFREIEFHNNIEEEIKELSPGEMMGLVATVYQEAAAAMFAVGRYDEAAVFGEWSTDVQELSRAMLRRDRLIAETAARLSAGVSMMEQENTMTETLEHSQY